MSISLLLYYSTIISAIMNIAVHNSLELMFLCSERGKWVPSSISELYESYKPYFEKPPYCFK